MDLFNSHHSVYHIYRACQWICHQTLLEVSIKMVLQPLINVMSCSHYSIVAAIRGAASNQENIFIFANPTVNGIAFYSRCWDHKNLPLAMWMHWCGFQAGNIRVIVEGFSVSISLHFDSPPSNTYQNTFHLKLSEVVCHHCDWYWLTCQIWCVSHLSNDQIWCVSLQVLPPCM